MTKPLLFALFILLIVFTACEQSEDDHSIDPGPRIKTITSRDLEGNMSTITFEYDVLGRISKRGLSVNSYEKYQYCADTLIVMNKYEAGKMTSIDSLWLNDHGLVVTKKSKSLPVSGIPVFTYTIPTTYEYNEGYLVKWSPGTHAYGIEDGNTVREILYSRSSRYPRKEDSTALEIVDITFTYEFIPNSINTIGNENMGMAFLGKQNKNLVSVWKSLTAGDPFDREYKGTINYQLDARQRVIKKISEKSLYPYTIYTYY